MQSSNSSDSESIGNGDVKSAFDTAREAFLSIEVNWMIEQLEVSAELGLGLEDAKELWFSRQLISLKRRYTYLLNARLPWWSVLRNPLWTLAFLLKRKKLLRDQSFSPDELDKLDATLGRAEFSADLSLAARNYLRQQIDNGELSRWTALSMVRSYGCKVSKDGGISPNPIGKFGMIFGSVSGLVLTIGCCVFVYLLSREMNEPCARLCVVEGASQMVGLFGYLAALSLSLSCGRQRAARLVPRVCG